MKVVVYNPFEIISTFTAALFAARDYEIYKSTDKIPEKAESYKFLGVDKITLPKGVKTTMKNDEICSWHDSVSQDDEGFHIDMFSAACLELGVDSKGLGPMLMHFNENKLNAEQLMTIFYNLKLVEGSIVENLRYFPNDDLSDFDKSQFYSYIASVKRKAERGYSIQYIECKDKFYRTAVTFFNEDFIWIKRLFLLGNKNIANIVATPNGCAIDTTLGSIDKLIVDMTCHKSNEIYIR